MNKIPFIIAVLCLIHISLYSQNTGSITLSIRLYPIQIIEVESSNTLSFEVLSENHLDSSLSPHLSTFSTSHYCLIVDTISNCIPQVLQPANGITSQHNFSTVNRLSEENVDSFSDNDYQIVYSMVTL